MAWKHLICALMVRLRHLLADRWCRCTTVGSYISSNQKFSGKPRRSIEIVFDGTVFKSARIGNTALPKLEQLLQDKTGCTFDVNWLQGTYN